MKTGSKPIVAFCLTSLLSIGGLLHSNPAAAGEAECAIWLCLPGGFPTGCVAAHAAMIQRLADFKPPLPSFSSCSAKPDPSDDNKYGYDYGNAAYIPRHTECATWKDRGGRNGDTYCANYVTYAEQYVRGTTCRKNNKEGTSSPSGCTKTYKYLITYVNGVAQGDYYYFTL